MISITRLAISPLIFFAVKADNVLLILILGALAVLTDFLDGLLARKLNSITETGKILDPLADKFCVAAGALSAMLYGDLPVVLFVVILLRDMVIVIAGLSIIKNTKMIPVSNIWGKVTVAVLTIVLIIYILKLSYLYTFAFWTAIAFAVISLASYFFAGLKFINNKYE